MADPLKLKAFVRHPELDFQRTSRFVVLGSGEGLVADEMKRPLEPAAAETPATGAEVRGLVAWL